MNKSEAMFPLRWGLDLGRSTPARAFDHHRCKGIGGVSFNTLRVRLTNGTDWNPRHHLRRFFSVWILFAAQLGMKRPLDLLCISLHIPRRCSPTPIQKRN